MMILMDIKIKPHKTIRKKLGGAGVAGRDCFLKKHVYTTIPQSQPSQDPTHPGICIQNDLIGYSSNCLTTPMTLLVELLTSSAIFAHTAAVSDGHLHSRHLYKILHKTDIFEVEYIRSSTE